MTIEEMLDALEVVSSHKYKEAVLPLIKAKKETVTQWICDDKRNDERNRGFYKALNWFLELENSLKRDIENEKKKAKN